MNSITDLLDLEDSEIIIKDIQIHGQTKTLFLETTPIVHFCPICGYRMHSRGVKSRKIKHPILQDNYSLILILKQRRWRCSNRNAGMTQANHSSLSTGNAELPMLRIC